MKTIDKKDLSGTDLHYSVCTDRDFDRSEWFGKVNDFESITRQLKVVEGNVFLTILLF